MFINKLSLTPKLRKLQLNHNKIQIKSLKVKQHPLHLHLQPHLFTTTNLTNILMNYRQKQKSLLIDPSNLLTFNVSHEHIHMKKIKTNSISNSRNQSSDDLQSIPDSSITVNTKIYYSVVEKQSESGISFNDRLFFLKDQDILGYMSKPDKNFDIKNAKQTIPIKCLRRVTPKGKTLMLEFQVKSAKDNNKMIQKKWLLRMKDKKMADAWTDIINYQVGQIPSRKSTMQRQDSRMTPLSTDRKQQMQTAQKTTNYFSKMQQPIANERPEQEYVSQNKKKRVSVQAKTPRSVTAIESNEISESPVRDQYSNSSNQKGDMSPELSAQRTYERERSSGFNSTSEKHSQKKERYLSSGTKFYQTGEFAVQSNYFEEIQLAFKQKNQEMRQKLILPSFYNYFRPYLDQLSKKRSSSRLQVDKKYEDFITYCQLTAKQLIDKNDTQLSDFKLSSRFLPQKDSSPKDKLLKEMTQMYEELFGKPMSQNMQLEALFLLFDNILYLSLEDTDLIVPLAELKTLPFASDNQNDSSNATLNKICQNSLITEFQTKEKNLQYIYSQISKHDVLKDNFLVPMSCQVEYKGFTMFFRPKVNETLFKAGTVYDSSLEIAYIANGNGRNQTAQLTLDEIYEKLASTLYVNLQVLENENHFKIKPMRGKQNLGEKNSGHSYKDFKYVIGFADILPYLESKQVVEPNIFMKVHQNDKIPNIQSLKSDFTEESSRKINPLNQEDPSLVPSVLKSQSIYKKKQTLKLPLYNQMGTAKQNDIQLRLYREEIKQRVKQVSKQLDRFDVSIIHPSQLNQLLKTSSLNHSCLGKVYQEISGKNSFVKSLIKSQIAAECTKFVLFKKCQQLIMSPKQDQPKQRDEISMRNVTTLLNLILGKSSTKQTEMIWKVLTLHSQLLYSVSISQQQIHKGYFILALSSKLNILINPNSVLIDDIFNHDKFLSAIRFQSCKIRPVQLVSSLLTEIQESQPKELIKNVNIYFKRLQQVISIASNPIPYFIKRLKHLYNKISLILTEKISPNNLNFNHLNLYQTKQLNFTQTTGSFPLIEQSRQPETATSLIKQKQLSLKRQFWEDNFVMYFRRKVKELQYKAVQRNSFNLQQQAENLMKQVKVFYEYHPVISEFLEFLSDYHLAKAEYQRAIDCLKASLSNIISVCEGNSNHVKLANCFLKIALVYERMGRYDDALNQLKRTKHCLEINKEDKTPFCAHLLLKIAKIAIKMDGKVHQSLSYVFAAQKILETQQNLFDNVDLIIDAYETQSKCLYSPELDISNLKLPQKLDRATRSQHYFVTLERILIKENEINKNKLNNHVELIDSEKLQKFFKLVLPFYFQGISQKGGQMLMIYMCELSENIAKRGGIDLTIPQVVLQQKPQTQRLQANGQPEFFFYPTTARSKPEQQLPTNTNSSKTTKKQYNFHEAFQYLKKQICDGSFIIQIMQFMQKADEILIIIKSKIKQNSLNKSQSRSSSRVYLMSTKGANDWDVVVNGEIGSEPNRKSEKGTPELRDDEEIDLEKLLDYSKEVRSSSHDAGYSQRERKFDSVMKALMVLLGDGFMLHIFEE